MAVLVVALVVWGAVDVRQRGKVDRAHPDQHRTDFTVFTDAGAAFFDGRDPYRVTNPRGWYYLYPPLFALMVAPLSVLDPQIQVCVWLAVNAVLAFGCYGEGRRLRRHLVAGPGASRPGLSEGKRGFGAWVGWCALAASFLPALDCVQRGQISLALLYPLLLGYRLVLCSRTGRGVGVGGLVLAWPVVVKVIPALPVAFLVLQHWSAALASRRDETARALPPARALALSRGLVVAGLLFVFLIPAVCVGWGANLRHLRTWAGKVAANTEVGRAHKFHIDSVNNQSLTNAAHLLATQAKGRLARPEDYPHWLAYDIAVANAHRADHVTRQVARATRGAALVLLVLLAVVTGVRGRASGQAAAFGLSCLAIVVVSPLAWAHYFVLWLPAILLMGPCLPWRRAPVVGFAMTAVPAVLSWGHYLAPRTVGAYGLLGVGTTAWFLAAAAILIRGGRRPAPPDTSPTGTLVLRDQGHRPGIRGRHRTTRAGIVRRGKEKGWGSGSKPQPSGS